MRWAGDVMDALASGVFFAPDENAEAYGQVVWSWRRDAGAKSAGSVPPVTVTTSPLHRGEHEVSRKAIAQGMSECFRCPVCSCAPNAQFLAHETAGAACTRHSLRPLFEEGQRDIKARAKHAARSRMYVVEQLRRVGKGALAPCPPSIRVFEVHGGHAEPVIGRAFARPVGFAHPTKPLIHQVEISTE